MSPRMVRLKREINPVYLIITEGHTEENYFRGFLTQLEPKVRNRFRIKNPTDTDVMGLLKVATDSRRQMDLDPEKGDRVFCVLDHPNVSSEVLRKANDQAGRYGIDLIVSSPCFELWFLLHFRSVCASMDQDEIIGELKKYLPKYKKGDQRTHAILEENTERAIENASRIELRNIAEVRNPSTNIQELIIFIRRIKGKGGFR